MAKLTAARIAAFLRDPGTTRVVLLHGEDNGLIRDRAEALVRLAAGSLDDPFRVCDLDRDGAARIPEEMAARSMIGGRRAIRVRDATDSVAAAVAAALAQDGDNLLVVEAGELTPRSKLRVLVEAAPQGAAIACYSEAGATLEQTIATLLREAGLTIDADALAFLTGQLGNDRGTTRQEIGKLALYMAPDTRVDLAAAMLTVGDMAGLQLDDTLHAATLGDLATTDRALGLALGEGATPIGVLRAMLMHLQKLQRARLAMQAGQSASDAVKDLRPPVRFARQAGFTRAVTLWSAAALAESCQAVWDAERQCKRTGTPDVTLCRHTVLTIARRAARTAR